MDKGEFGFGHAEIKSSMNPSWRILEWCSEERSELEIDLSYHDGVFTDAVGMK